MIRAHINSWLSAILCILFLIGCNEFGEDDFAYDDQVRLKAVLASGAGLETKGEGVIESQYDKELTIGLVRVDQNADQTYPAFSSATEILKADMTPGEESVNIRDIEFDGTYQTFLNSTSGIKYASWYPYVNSSLTDGIVTVPIDGSTDILYGSVAEGRQTTGFNTIAFNHALAKFTFKVYAMIQKDENGNNITDPDAIWGALKDVRMISTSRNCNIVLPDSEDEYAFSFDESSGNVQSLSIKEVTGVQSFMDSWNDCIGVSNAIYIGEIIAAPPQDDILKLQVFTDKASEVSQELTIARDFRAGNNYEVFLRFSDHGFINSEVSVGEWIEDDQNHTIESGTNKTFYDLSANQTANCYVISSANYSYCFDVSVKGNTTERIYPDKVDIIWMDDNLEGSVALVSSKPIRGRVMLDVIGDEDENVHKLKEEGNVLIGAYQGEDLVWCWHVWLTDRPQEQSYKNGFVALDRDLGAVTPYGDGLYYQWGRPTPFALGRTVSDADGSVISPYVADDKDVDIEERILNPLKFYSERVVSEAKSHLWGWVSDKDGYEKSKYDPCPVGYRVPSKRLWRDLVVEDLSLYENHALNFTVDSYYEVYYPFSGYYGIEGNDIKLIGYYSGSQNVDSNTGAYMWAATYDKNVENADGTTGSPYALDYSLDEEAGNLGEMQVINTVPGTYALPVRCVSLHSEPQVHDLSAYQTANSYMVTTPNRYYKFKADVKGNGVGTLVQAGSAGSIVLHQNEGVDLSSSLVNVDYLWWQGDLSESGANSSPKDRLPLQFEDGGRPDEDGYVTFFVDELIEGNMIVAGYDSRGTVVWSWHLWFLDEEPEIKNSNDYAVMDRFLGATVAPTVAPADASVALGSLGLYYQWGRKDPFQGPKEMSQSSGVTTGFSDIWVYDRTAGTWSNKSTLTTENVADNKSIINSVANPMTYFCASDTSVYPWYDGVVPQTGFYIYDVWDVWSNSCFENYVDGGTCRPNLWGYSSASGFGTTTTKTMYDPCPPGYSVSYYLLWSDADIWSDADTKRDYYSGPDNGDIYSTSGPGTEASTYGIFLNDQKYGLFDYTWCPFTGYIKLDGSGLLDVGVVGRFHSPTPGGLGSRSLWYNQYYTGQAVGSNYCGIPSSYAYPVRCQKD